ncbi:MAG TPA: NAD(P)-binding domain-containing protein [Woeseiaceae bacterium]|nr:NAD(P)-binding domain-containing protein [Woeseiaceae bacterium]
MRIGVLGTGVVGKVLAAGFAGQGHEVMIGSRQPEKLADWLHENPGVGSGFFGDTAAFAELVVLAVKGTAANKALSLAGEENHAGKPVIDATNPIADQPPVKGVLRFFTNLDESLMEQLQKQYPRTKFVKAFNSVSSARMVNPHFEGGKPTMFICGNDEQAKSRVTELLDQLGWETEDMGPVEAARAIEPLCMLYCIPGLTRDQWGHAFKLLK